MNMRANIAAASAAPFTASDYIALQRMVGNEFHWHYHAGHLTLGVCRLNQKSDDWTDRKYVAGLAQFREWKAVTPNWKEQVVAELAREHQPGGQNAA